MNFKSFKIAILIGLCWTLFSGGITIYAAAGDEESEIGREVVALYLGAAPLINDKKILEYVNTLGQHIVSFVPKSEQTRDWRFGVIESSGVNAFAAPGGYILITRGLLNLTETEDQLAFILAHEISHVVKRHHLKVIQKQKQMSRLLSKMQSNMKESNELFQGLSGVYRDFATKGLDKNAEHEADLDGSLLAARAGFNLMSGQELLFILSEFYRDGNEAQLFFKTHPHPLSRVDKLSESLPTQIEKFAVDSDPSSGYRDLKR